MKLQFERPRAARRLPLRGLVGVIGGSLLLSLTACTPVVTSGSGTTPDPLAGCPGLSDAAYDATADSHSLYRTATETGAVAAYWNAGYTGAGVGIAVIDTGVAPVDGLNAPGKIAHGPDLSDESQSPFAYNDGFGHGTHMASIAAGRSNDVTVSTGGGLGLPTTNTYATQAATKFMGIAPDAKVLSLKVGDHYGAADVTQIVAAINWVVEHKADSGLGVPIRVLNLSYGVALDNVGWRSDLISYALDQAWKAGIAVVVPAGNDEQEKGTLLTSPGYNENVISVGAYDPADQKVTAFTSDSGYRRPDFVAPGQSIAALRVCGSAQDDAIAATGTASTSYVGRRFVRGSGTSQAAAVASGAVALMIQKNPCWNTFQIKSALRQTATNLPLSNTNVQGQGKLNLAKAANETRACPTSGWNALGTTMEQAQGGSSVDASRGPDGHLWDPSRYCNADNTFLPETLTALQTRYTWPAGYDFSVLGCFEHAFSSLAWPDGQVLRGNFDIFGKPFNQGSFTTVGSHAYKTFVDKNTGKLTYEAGAWTTAPGDANGDGVVATGETVEMWNGTAWAGTGMTTVNGAPAWNASRWSASRWNASRWSEESWNASRWSADGWTASRWTDGAWQASRWTDEAWQASRWSASRWSDEAWQ